MYHLLAQSLHSTQSLINVPPYPWLSQQQPQQPPQPQPQGNRNQQQQPQGNRNQQQQPQGNQPQPQGNGNQQPQQPFRTTIPLRTTVPMRPQTNHALENSIVNALMSMLYQPPAERRLTQAELDERVELTQFGNIANPLNTVCSITHDVFETDQQVARIRHCGHIFNSDSLAHWLRMNNTCPTCRHNLRSETNATNVTNAMPDRIVNIPLASDLNINSVYNELLRNSTNIPGFELNSVNDDSIIFSFDLINNRANRGSSGGAGPSTSGSSGAGSSGAGSSTGAGPRSIDEVD